MADVIHSASNTPNAINQIALRDLLIKHTVSDDLRTFCFELQEPYEQIVGPNDKLQMAVIALIEYFDKRGRLPALVARAQREFPLAAWPTIEIQAEHKAAPGQTTPVPARTARTAGPLRVFMCHASQDKDAVQVLSNMLKDRGIETWLDAEQLRLGQRWRIEIPKAMQRMDAVLVCLSNYSVQKDGYIKSEIQFALDHADKLPDDALFILPVRLEDCRPPERLSEYHWLDLFAATGPRNLIEGLAYVAEQVGAPAPAQAAPPPVIVRSNPDLLILDQPFKLELIRIPAGPFLMGSDKAKDSEAYDDELPQHGLTLGEYYIGKTAITNAQFAGFVQATGHKTTAEKEGTGGVWTGKWDWVKGADWRHPNGPKSNIDQKSNHPVVQISWHDAQAFCTWLSQTSGHKAMLPSEAEFEKAARGPSTRSGDGRIYPWGNEPPSDDRLNFNMTVKDTTPVGRYSPKGDSPYGCADMSGNVWEWTRSLWGKDVNTPEFKYPYVAGDGREDLSASDDVRRVVRGGSWNNNHWLVRAAVRDRLVPSFRLNDLGLRVVVSAPV